MALTRLSTGLFKTDSASVDFNLDSGAFFVDVSTNNVGIGTTSPYAVLNTQVTSNFSTTYNDYSGDGLHITCDATQGSGNYGGGISFSRIASGSSHRKAGIALVQTNTDADECGLAFFTAPSPTSGVALSEKMRLDDEGNLGIGISPASKLHINLGTDKNIRFQGDIGEIGSVAGFQAVNDAGSSLGSFGIRATDIRFATGSSERMRIDSSGNVGIGVTPASAEGGWLQFGNNYSYSQRGIGNNTYFDGSNYRSMTSGYAATLMQQGDSFLFYTAGTVGTGAVQTFTERMRIDNSGEAMVGMTSGSNFAGAMSAKGFGSRSGYSGSQIGNLFNIAWTGGSPYLWIDTTNLGAIAISSDYRIKRNVETQTTTALDRIQQIRPVTYQRAEYGTLFQEDDLIREGFIAHELQEVIPSAVEGEKDADDQIQSLKLDALCSVMVKAIQEQQAIIEDLKARIQTLEGN